MSCLKIKDYYDNIIIVVKDMKHKKMIKIVLILFIILDILFLFQSTYAKYRKKVDQNIDIGLADWNILLNNQSIVGKDTVEGEIIPIFEQNENVKENKLAPGVKGYFDITINATNVDVSFSYDLSVSVADAEKYSDIKAYGYQLDPDNTTEILDYNGESIGGNIVHNTPLTKIRIYIRWDDDEGSTMSNQEDTMLAITNKTLKMKAAFRFEQLKE